jgi:phosphoglucan,water dikinase
LLDRLERLTTLRQLFAGRMNQADPHLRSQLRLADIGLEDYAFVLLGECVNRLGNLTQPGAWPALPRALLVCLDNLRLSSIEVEECGALRSEFTAWSTGFSSAERFHLLRTLASLARARRLAEGYTDRINQLFPPRVEELGRALGVMEHARKVFSEGDVRGHVVFQLSRLVDLGLGAARRLLGLPPWEAVVPGEASGRLSHATDLMEVEGQGGPLLLLLERADGDAEIPAGVKGIALGHPLPHLSHLGVRARQAGVPFAACASREHLADFERLVGKWVRMRVTPEGLSLEESANNSLSQPAEIMAGEAVTVPEATLAREPAVLPLDQARPETCGAKATAAWRLLELAGQSAGLFHAPRGLALPFGVMEQ